MEDCSCDPNGVALDVPSAFCAAVAMTQVVFLAVHLIVKLVVGSFDLLLADAADLASVLEVLLADRFVLEEEVGVPERLVAHMALHAARVVVGVVIHHAVSHNFLFANTALLLISLVAFGAKRLVILGKELPVQFFLASMTSETLLVVNLSKCCAAIISQIPFAVVTTFGWFAHCFHCPVSYSCQHFRVIQVPAGETFAWKGFGRGSRGP